MQGGCRDREGKGSTRSCSRSFLAVLLCVCAMLPAGVAQVHGVLDRGKESKQATPQCGTLDLTSKLTKHCFPKGAHRHNVCCIDILLPEATNRSGTTSFNLLEDRIRQASDASSFSWCACSEKICTHQLGGRVAWVMEVDGSISRPLGSPALISRPLGSPALQNDVTSQADVKGGRPMADVCDLLNISAGRVSGLGLLSRLMDVDAGGEEADRGAESIEKDDEEIDLELKLSPLSKEQLMDLIAGLIAKDERIGGTVLRLAKKRVDTSGLQHQMVALQTQKATAQTFVDELSHLFEQAHLYARAGDHRNALALCEALCANLLLFMPNRDPELALEALWVLAEKAFEISVEHVKKKSELLRISKLLTGWRESLSGTYGPIFSDALRALARIVQKRKKKKGKVGAEFSKEEFFAKHRVSKNRETRRKKD